MVLGWLVGLKTWTFKWFIFYIGSPIGEKEILLEVFQNG